MGGRGAWLIAYGLCCGFDGVTFCQFYWGADDLGLGWFRESANYCHILGPPLSLLAQQLVLVLLQYVAMLAPAGLECHQDPPLVHLRDTLADKLVGFMCTFTAPPFHFGLCFTDLRK